MTSLSRLRMMNNDEVAVDQRQLKLPNVITYFLLHTKEAMVIFHSLLPGDLIYIVNHIVYDKYLSLLLVD